MKTWSRGRTLGAGIGLIVLTNAIALGGVWWNRSSTPESALTLSERELGLPWRSLRLMENSGLALNLNVRVAGRQAGEFAGGQMVNGGTPEWLDAAKMAALGFPVDTARADGERQQHARELPREVILVMELAGPAWQRALEKARESAGRHAAAAAVNVGSKQFADRAKQANDELAREENSNSRLFVIDAAAASCYSAGPCGPPRTVGEMARPKRPASSPGSATARFTYPTRYADHLNLLPPLANPAAAASASARNFSSAGASNRG